MSMEDPQPSPRLFYDNLHGASSPSWRAKTRAWVEDQEVCGPKFANQTTRDWVWAQQMREAEELDAERREKERVAEREWREATVRSIDEQAKRWMVHAEEARQAALRETEKTRKIQEEVRRVKERSEAREAERRKLREEVRKMGERTSSAKTRMARENAAKKLIEAWNAYESRWAALQTSPKERLTFRTIPWPLIATPSSPSSISNANVAFFLLSPLHSGKKSRKDRMREAMQRWHTDKFEPRILPRVVESDRSAVKEGVGIVVRCLNDLLARQGSSS